MVGGVSQEAEDNGGQETRLIVLTGTIKGNPSRFLVDGGASYNFIDEKLLWESGFISLAKESPDTIKLANGQMESSSIVLRKARTHIGTYKDSLKFHATRLEGFYAILGKEWLAKTNPDIDWRQNTLQFEYNGKVHTLWTPPEEDIDFSIRHMMLTNTELERAFTQKEPMYLCTSRRSPDLPLMYPTR